MAIKSMFFNAIKTGDVYDREYNADDFSRYLEKIIGNGVFANPSTNLQISAQTGLNVIASQGHAWIEGHKLINTAAMVLSLDAADPLLNRIDRVVCYCDYVNRDMGIEVIKGTPAASPTAPAITRTDSRFELSLALITINKQVTTITNADITDTRADTTVCGWVTGIIDQVDTSTLFQQWQTAYADYYADIKQQLDDFIETLTEDLGVNTYLKEFYYRVTAAPGIMSISLSLSSISDYTYEATDVIRVYTNGILGSEGTDYIFDTSSNPPTIQINFSEPSDVQTSVDLKILKTKIGINQ